MQIWQEEDNHTTEHEGGCCGLSAVNDARRVADMLDIPYYVMNFRKEFQDNVINYFTDSYLRGMTPNPCIACNRYVKWEALLKRSLDIGADYIATGHYARVIRLNNGRYAIQKSKTDTKDQTYALYNLTQQQLAHTLMPVGDFEKPQIRKLAEDIGLIIANKPDSQEICFIPDNDYAGYIQRECDCRNIRPGNFVDKEGNVLGAHRGIIHYTIGQRKGLNLSMGRPVFVTDIRTDTNEVVIGDSEDVFSRVLYADNVNYMAVEDIEDGAHAYAKIRYSHKGASCIVNKCGDGRLKVIFDEPQRAVTPGQAVVFYDDDIVLGGGTIIKY